MSHYKANVRDLEFNLFEVLELEKALATGEFGDVDGEAVRHMLAEAARVAQGPLAESFADGGATYGNFSRPPLSRSLASGLPCAPNQSA
jgi:hypothetical protein